ncbi:MAG: type II secretion system GspH family protein [Candidatus Eremiobacteraeota bacterium]|nr:type II secretion system GspH family protein [Candidatus Eremiobacteraeota bacterium]MCL5055824.1 type II secretion system GspH family protein [Bacillota bacterium]
MVKRKILPKGLSLLEILFAMLILMMSVATFAMVFPSGYSLNSKTLREDQAVSLGQSILNEIARKPAYSSTRGIGDSLNNLLSWTNECPPDNQCANDEWTPTALTQFEEQNPSLEKAYQYQLPSSNSKPPGIKILFLSGQTGGLGYTLSCAQPDTCNPTVEITINLEWQEPVNGGMIKKNMSLSTWTSYNLAP